MRSALALVALLFGVATFSTSALGAERTASAGPRVTIFGDSVADSLSYVPDARQLLGEGLDLRLELAPCRKLVPQGCVYRGERPPSVLDIVKSSSLSQLGNIVIVAVGYNDPANNYETDMAQVAIALVDLGVAHVIWLTLREQTDDYRQINATIRDQARRWPQVQIADWEKASRGKDWFNADGLHLNADGAIGLATLIRPFVLAACGSACAATPKAPRNVRPPTLRGTADRRPHPHVPAWFVGRDRSDRVLVPLAARNEGARGRDRQLAAPRTHRRGPERLVPGLGGKRQRSDGRDVESRADPSVRVAVYAAVEAASDDVVRATP